MEDNNYSELNVKFNCVLCGTLGGILMCEKIYFDIYFAKQNVVTSEDKKFLTKTDENKSL